MKIAIIGTGISGLGAAYLLSAEHDVQVFEKNAYLGGHSRTIDVTTGNSTTPVDTGFIVFNDWNYPNLIALFELLDVPYQKSDMSFGVSIDDSWLEYASGGLFAQKRNLVRPAFYGMLRDVFRFNKEAPAYIERATDITLGECLEQLNLGGWFKRYYILAMGASIWSCPIEAMLKFPAKTFLRFFKNHGLLSINKRPQWYTVTGGSREYIKRLTERYQDHIHLNRGVSKVMRQQDKLVVIDEHGKQETFDQVVFSCHADQALSMIEQPTQQQHEVLSAFSYQDNHIIVHSDISFMPKQKKCWASWVYLSEQRQDEKPQVSLSYWMNNLQNLAPQYPIFVTLNPGRRPDQAKIMDEHYFSHPIFDVNAIKAQSKITDIQGQNGLWFCGAYQRYGFHEDGLLSAVTICRNMGVTIPWQ
jgi:predicted NAD/FAD-binding protein